jgi:CxxC motif-containing protein (DUF1111 family)
MGNRSARLVVLVAGALSGIGCGASEPLPLHQAERPAAPGHLEHAAIGSGAVPIEDVLAHGEALFVAPFNSLDGAGRPETTGTGVARTRREAPENFNRISAPDADSCAGCHNVPRVGGGGDNVANVFVLGQRFPFVDFGMPPGEGDGFQEHGLLDVANERNTLGMFGSGFVELLAREMSSDLQAIRAGAIADAVASGLPETRSLDTKGVNFGMIVGRPDGTADTSGVEGVDADLVVRPFHQKGVVVSLREFSNNAFNHHHGMQSAERFGADADPDGDGVRDEMTVGDITAATLFQATLPVPGRVLPADAEGQAAVTRGEALFSSIGCASCHVPELRLEDPVFTEPGPFNPPGNVRAGDVDAVVAVDLTVAGGGPRLAREVDGSVRVPLFSDLKRHDMGPALDTERLVQAGVPTRQWLTRKLWGMASEPHFLHHGRATLLSEAILLHGGEGQAARDAFEALPPDDRAAVVEFLKTLRILPEDAPSLAVVAPREGGLGDAPALPPHLDQASVDAGDVPLGDLIRHGERLFGTPANTLDGQGRPETTGTGAPRARREAPENFNRVSAPDADTCAGCHNLPRAGGGGDNVANVFVLGQRFPFVNFDGGAGDGFEMHTLRGTANERNTPGMFGAGYIELLAREMTADLHRIRDRDLALAASTDATITSELSTKGVSFGRLTCRPDGTADTSEVEGVDADLVVRPFHQKGVVVSLREFTNNAFNHHHGLQASERFGEGTDRDADGVRDELTEGDVTAATIFQASLPVPGRVLPESPVARAAAERGETLFAEIGCAHCHVPALRLESPVFTEPGPFNPAGNLRSTDVARPFAFDLTSDGPVPRLPREPDGSVLVPAFTDLKRHDMGPALDTERLVQAGVPTREWITRKLWGIATEPHFLHHGRATLLSEAILLHGGEAQVARDAFEALSPAEQSWILEFLQTLRVLPEGETRLVIER